LVKATLEGLSQLQSPQQIKAIRFKEKAVAGAKPADAAPPAAEAAEATEATPA
jgi:hypothetical protein